MAYKEQLARQPQKLGATRGNQSCIEWQMFVKRKDCYSI